MNEREKILKEFYENEDEDSRLRSKHGSIEFLTTIKYVDMFLKRGDKILEIGAGTGIYSLYYASQGYKVEALEYVERNIEVLKSNIKENMDINAQQGDAVDLSRYDDNTFDVTLSFGPLYHLYIEEDIDKAIKEAIRVTKKDGIIMFAYLTNDSIMVSFGLMKNHLVDNSNTYWDENFKIVSRPSEIFRAFYISDFKNMMLKYNVQFLKNITTDGISSHFKDKVNTLSEEEFNVWFRYHISTCEREDLQGFSKHMLYICRK